VITTATPEWLLQPEVALCPCGCIGRRRKANFVDKTLQNAGGLLLRTMFAEDAATRDGLLQRCDARAKLAGGAVLLLAAALVHDVRVLVVLYLLTLAVAVASKLGAKFFVQRVWLFVPLFTGIVVLPATLNVITPGRIVVPLGTWFGYHLGVTSQGASSAAVIVVRVATSISLVVLLTLTTRFADLLTGLRALHVPRLFVLVFSMAYRYVFVLLATVDDMYTARKARAVLDTRNTKRGRQFVAASAGALFGRAHALSDEVHQAMLARGFRGEARSLRVARITANDVVVVLVAVVVSFVALGGERVLR
jgi:cobalt/nickel transport system permease protein